MILKHTNDGETMKIRLGYACISKTIEETSSSTYSYTNYLKDEHHTKKLESVIISNLIDLGKIIDYNIKNNIHFFRLSSKLIPLATHKDVIFDYSNNYQEYYDILASKIQDSNMRVDFHPDQFTVLNSTKKEVVENTFRILEYHYQMLENLKIKNKILILHIGSSVFGKQNSIKRFINNFNKLPDYLRNCIAIENDDKIYNINDCLTISNALNIPIVLDYHHHICNHENKEIEFEKIFMTWKNITPKVHFSSPKNKTKKDFRSHHDYINSDDFIEFIEKIKHLPYNVDIMIEAKAKDEALFRLIRELKYKTNYHFIDETTFEI